MIPNEFEAAFSAGVDIVVIAPPHPGASIPATTSLGETLSAVLPFLSYEVLPTCLEVDIYCTRTYTSCNI